MSDFERLEELLNRLNGSREKAEGVSNSECHEIEEYGLEAIDHIKKLEQKLSDAEKQPRLTVKLQSYPETNGKRNWTALLVRVDKWGGLVGNSGGISIAHGELWNRVAYEAERTKLLIGERDTEPCILDYGEDIETPEEWKGEVRGGRVVKITPPEVDTDE